MNGVEANGEYVVQLRGLPYEITMDEVVKFLDGIAIKGGKRGIRFPKQAKKMIWGEAFIILENEEEFEKAKLKHMQYIKNRYIEVFPSSMSTLKSATSGPLEDLEVHRKDGTTFRPIIAINEDRSKPVSNENRRYTEDKRFQSWDNAIKLRGLPFDCTKDNVLQFFKGYEIAPSGLSILVDAGGRSVGTGFVQLASSVDAHEAINNLHMKKIGHRYIEVLRSSLDEANAEVQRQMDTNEMSMGYRENYGHEPPRMVPRVRGREDGRVDFDRRMPPVDFANRRARSRSPIGMPRGRREGDFYDTRYEQYGNASKGEHSRALPRANEIAREDNIDGGKHRGDGKFSSGCPGVHLSGLSYTTRAEDLIRFFSPLKPLNVNIAYANGKPTGEADVDFESSEEAARASYMNGEKLHGHSITVELPDARKSKSHRPDNRGDARRPEPDVSSYRRHPEDPYRRPPSIEPRPYYAGYEYEYETFDGPARYDGYPDERNALRY